MIDHKKLRNRLNLAGETQREMAKAMGITEQRVSFFLNNDTNPTSDTLFKMCEFLGCSANELKKD